MPAAWLSLVFVIEAVILAGIPNLHNQPRYVGGLASVYATFFVLGLLSIVQMLPFGLSLGVSRRAYYLGTIFLAIALALVYGLGLAVLQVIERSTNGWGVSMYFFRVPHVLDGPWYLTCLTSFVVLTLTFGYGIWYGLVYRRWNVTGLLTFIAGQLAIILVAAIIATWTENWDRVGHFFTTLSAAGLAVVLAALAVILLIGGYTTARLVTV